MAVLLLSLKTNHDDRPIRLNTKRCALSLPPPLYNCLTVDMLFNIVGHKIDCNYETWKNIGQKRRGTVLPQVGGRLSHTLGQDGFFGAVQIMLIFFHIAYFPKTTVDKVIEDIFIYNMILWDLC